jgi:hypothetical protein
VLLTDSSVSAKCSDCGTPRHTVQTLYLICGIIKKDLSVAVNEAIYIKERIDRVGVMSQIIKKYFIPCAIATFASAFTGPITNNVFLCIGIDIALGIASLILGLQLRQR